MSVAHFNIGSNIGHRATNIDCAVSYLGRRVGRVIACSRPVETAPWGFDSENQFLNVGVNIETRLTPLEIIAEIQAIEHDLAPEESHRDSNGNYVDRSVDIDLICYGNSVSNDPIAIVPHPRMHLREFVLMPLVELMPEWEHPILHKTAAKLLAELSNK